MIKYALPIMALSFSFNSHAISMETIYSQMQDFEKVQMFRRMEVISENGSNLSFGRFRIESTNKQKVGQFNCLDYKLYKNSNKIKTGLMCKVDNTWVFQE